MTSPRRTRAKSTRGGRPISCGRRVGRATDRTAPSIAGSGTASGAAALVLAAVTGGLVVRFPAAAPVPVVLVGTAAAASARPTARVDAVRGASVAVLLLALLNGIPGVDLSGQPVRGASASRTTRWGSS